MCCFQLLFEDVVVPTFSPFFVPLPTSICFLHHLFLEYTCQVHADPDDLFCRVVVVPSIVSAFVCLVSPNKGMCPLSITPGSHGLFSFNLNFSDSTGPISEPTFPLLSNFYILFFDVTFLFPSFALLMSPSSSWTLSLVSIM